MKDEHVQPLCKAGKRRNTKNPREIAGKRQTENICEIAIPVSINGLIRR